MENDMATYTPYTITRTAQLHVQRGKSQNDLTYIVLVEYLSAQQ